MTADRAVLPLIRAASAYYRGAGKFAWRFARVKLARDPVYAAILAHGLLAGRARILDLGCGQALLAAWLLAARALHASGRADAWPGGWPAPPQLESYLGIDINPQEVARARRAFALDPGARLSIVHGDIGDVDYGTADAVVILDVLHYIDPTAQERVLARARAALPPAGLLLVRVGDAGAGAGFALSKAVDRAVALLRRGHWRSLQCRPLHEWQHLLASSGFSTRIQPMRHVTPFAANLLLIAHAA